MLDKKGFTCHQEAEQKNIADMVIISRFYQTSGGKKDHSHEMKRMEPAHPPVGNSIPEGIYGNHTP